MSWNESLFCFWTNDRAVSSIWSASTGRWVHDDRVKNYLQHNCYSFAPPNGCSSWWNGKELASCLGRNSHIMTDSSFASMETNASFQFLGDWTLASKENGIQTLYGTEKLCYSGMGSVATQVILLLERHWTTNIMVLLHHWNMDRC